MHNEARPFVNPQRISSCFLTDCMRTFSVQPKLFAFVCVTKKLTFLLSGSHCWDTEPPNLAWNFGWSEFWRWKRLKVFCSRCFANLSKRFLTRHCRNRMMTRSDHEILPRVVSFIPMSLLVLWAPPMGWKLWVKHLVFGAHKINCDLKTEMQLFLQKKVVSYLTSILRCFTVIECCT